MLNPSTADEHLDDPTIRRCIGFATSWGCTELNVVNLFALRATDPKALKNHPDPVGPRNDAILAEYIEFHTIHDGIIVAAWGANKLAKARAASLAPLFANARCLALNRDGSPKHPLYCRADLVPAPLDLRP